MSDTGDLAKRWVWVPCPANLYKPAYIVTEDSFQTTVQSDALETFKNSEVFKMNPSKFNQVEDLGSLSHLNEPSVLQNIKSRYDNASIYTYSGLFLLALNPYRNMNIYTDEKKRQVMLQKRREGPPHIFVVANEAYRSMVTNRENQSILITGESGAGKTENTKRVTEFLAFAARGSAAEPGTRHLSVETALKSATPVLEAFGNAKTVKNDNSSRFGKFIQIKFKGGTICGARIQSYLLEKTRVPNTASSERNFHVFYYLLSGASSQLLKELSLTNNPRDYNCLKNTLLTIPGVDDAEEFKKLNEAFKDLGLDPSGFYRVLSAILQLSNVKLTEPSESQGACKIENIETVEHVCRLLNIPVTDFINNLLHPLIKAGSEEVMHYRTKQEATSVIEGLMKTLYETAFSHLVASINQQLDSDCDNYIGILDIAGFEIFKKNSFEQLCINYTNEKLQQFFNHHMFILEQELYRTEEIPWDFIDFGLDLEPTIQAIESVNPIGILAYLDEECVMPWSNDNSVLDKLTKVKLVKKLPLKNSIIIKHYAGEVEYDTRGWLKKNRDVESEGLAKLIDWDELLGPSETQDLRRRTRSITGVKKGIFRTVAQSHKENLRNLMKTLKETHPHFVRCILPNLKRDPSLFDRKLVLDQLRCNGVLEGIRISRLGYPSRLFYEEFVSRYSMLVDGCSSHCNREATEKIVSALKIGDAEYKMGNKRVFFRQGILADLEERRDRVIGDLGFMLRGILRGKMELRRENLEGERRRAIRNLQKNANSALKLLRWRWWSLLQSIAPLLDVKRSENKEKMMEKRLRELEAVIERQKIEAAEKAETVAGMEQRVSALQGEIAACEVAVSEREELLGVLRAEIGKAREALDQSEREKVQAHEMAAELKTELGKVAVKHAEESAVLSRLLKEIEERNQEIAERERQVAEAEVRLLESEERERSMAQQVEKLRMEFSDLQLSNGNLAARSNLQEEKAKEAEKREERAREDLEFQKSVNATLEKRIKLLRMEAEKPVPVVVPVEDDGVRREAVKLREKCRVLIEEREELRAENLRLAQSKLDELFNCEAEAAASKAALRTEIRRLETENARLAREAESLMSGSEYSEELPSLTLLLEEERERANLAGKERDELERQKARLEGEVSGLREEIRAMEVLLRENARGVREKDVQRLRRELSLLRTQFNSICESFQRDFFRVLRERETACAEGVEELVALRREVGELSEWRGRCRRVEAEKEALDRDAVLMRNELEALRVSSGAAEQRIQELEAHLEKVAAAFNEREATVRGVLEAAAQERRELVKRAEELARIIGSRKCSGEEVAKLREELVEQRSENSGLRREVAGLVAQVEEWKRAYEAGVKKLESPEPVVVERLVSSLVVDREALQSLLWKRIVSEKCTRCAEEEKETGSAAELAKLNGEVSALRLKLMQSERRNEENARLIESMRACIGIHRNKKQVKQ